jgi:hypothetical protein
MLRLRIRANLRILPPPTGREPASAASCGMAIADKKAAALRAAALENAMR